MAEENKENKENKKENVCELILKDTENVMEYIHNEGLNTENIELLYKAVDVHKDLKNESYWKEKIDMYRDYDYSDYGRQGVKGTGPYSRYRDGEYGRRGRRYRGHDMLEDMHDAYSDYMESAEHGHYGTSESMMKIEVMADSLMDFIHHIKKEAKTPEERELIERKLHEIGRM